MNLIFAFIPATVVTDLMVFLTCQSIHSDNKTLCNVLHTDSQSQEALNLEAEAQPYASYILMCQALVEGIVPALLSFFLGPWSDKYGRKPLLLAGYSGELYFFLILWFYGLILWFIIERGIRTEIKKSHHCFFLSYNVLVTFRLYKNNFSIQGYQVSFV